MGIISDAKAIKNVQKIKRGGLAKLSISQITNLIINLMDAKKNLSKNEYVEVEELFHKLRKNNKKIEMDIEKYVSTVVDIIREFDVIAPYEKYSGLNETKEFSSFMKDVRSGRDVNFKKKNNPITWNEWVEKNFHNRGTTTRASDYIKKNSNEVEEIFDEVDFLVQGSNGIVNETMVIDFLKILKTNPNFNKNRILNDFNSFAKKLMDADLSYSIVPISFFLGVLNANGIITEKEMGLEGNKYQEIILDKMKNQPKDDDMSELKNYALYFQKKLLLYIEETISNKELINIAGLLSFNTMLLYVFTIYDNCDDKGNKNYSSTDDKLYQGLYYMYIVWAQIFSEADNCITAYQNATSKKSYNKY